MIGLYPCNFIITLAVTSLFLPWESFVISSAQLSWARQSSPTYGGTWFCGLFGPPLCYLNIWLIPQILHLPHVPGQLLQASVWLVSMSSLWAEKWLSVFYHQSCYSLLSTVSHLIDENTGLVETRQDLPELIKQHQLAIKTR